jgi:hypothetical protein
MVLLGSQIDVTNVMPWTVASALLLIGGVWLRKESRSFARVWEKVTTELQEARA